MYARVFNVVEIDSTFYRVPEDDVIESWKSNTPPDFLFCPKMPGALTHDGRLRVVGRTLESFLRAANLFGEKLGPVLIQLPPSFAYDEGIDRLQSLLSAFPREATAAVEFRHHSWFRAETYELPSYTGQGKKRSMGLRHRQRAGSCSACRAFSKSLRY